jgi:hypothetical protein
MDTSSSIFKRGFQPSSADYIPVRYYSVPVFADFIQHLAVEGGKFPHFLSDSFYLCLAFSVMAFMIADYLVVMHPAWPKLPRSGVRLHWVDTSNIADETYHSIAGVLQDLGPLLEHDIPGVYRVTLWQVPFRSDAKNEG